MSTVDQMNAQSLVLAQLATQYGVDTQHGKDPNAAAAQAIKAQLIQAQKDLAAITAQKAQVHTHTYSVPIALSVGSLMLI